MNNLIKFTLVRTTTCRSIGTRFVHNTRSLLTLAETDENKLDLHDTRHYTSLHERMLERNLNNLIKISRQYEKNLNGIIHTQRVLTNELKAEEPKISIFELKELLYMSKTDEDLDILAKAISRYIEANKPNLSRYDYNNDFARRFLELLYLLKKTSKAIEYFNNPDLQGIFKNYRASEVLLKLVADANLYDDFVSILNKYLPRYYRLLKSDREQQQSGSSGDDRTKTSVEQRQNARKNSEKLLIPISHMDIITKFLLTKNTPDSLKVYADLIYRIERSGAEVDTFFKLRFILLALLQNNGEMAFNAMRNNLCEKDIIMKTNLKAIIFSKLRKHDECLKVLKNMFIHDNKLFPFTLKMLRQDMERLESKTDDDVIGYKNQIDFFYKRAYLDDRIYKNEDLPELLTRSLMINTEVYVCLDNRMENELDEEESPNSMFIEKNKSQSQLS